MGPLAILIYSSSLLVKQAVKIPRNNVNNKFHPKQYWLQWQTLLAVIHFSINRYNLTAFTVMYSINDDTRYISNIKYYY